MEKRGMDWELDGRGELSYLFSSYHTRPPASWNVGEKDENLDGGGEFGVVG